MQNSPTLPSWLELQETIDKNLKNSEKTATGDSRKGDLFCCVGRSDYTAAGDDVNNTSSTVNKLNLPKDIFSKKIESANGFLLAVCKYKYREMSWKESLICPAERKKNLKPELWI